MKISEFQKLIRNLYLEQDQKRGLQKTFTWLIEEIGELAHILRSKEIESNSASEELADIIAWTTSLANLLDIDLEDALFTKYPNMCIKCESNPCICWKLNLDTKQNNTL
ncbi:MAG: MazG nucleotide pyrophosphohydrolase domain-containing protein [Promethearchaeota archaeon]|jgi:NTP pyrophosphatase (non-canonical NTP hydrolase)